MKRCSFFYMVSFVVTLCVVFVQCRKSDSPLPPDYSGLWQKLNTPYFGKPLDIQFTSGDTGYILGKDTTIPTGTTIIKTFDGGNTWQKIYFPENYVSPILMPTSQLNVSPFNSSILFSSSQWQRGIVAIRSTDGGYHWSKVDTIIGFWGRYHFISPSEVIRAGNKIFKSVDSGFTWTKTYDKSGFANFDMLQFPSTGVGYTAGGIAYDATNYGIMAKTSDGGNSWQNIDFSFHAITGMSFINDNIGYVTMDMDSGNIVTTYPGGTDLYKTENGGNIWHMVNKNIFSNYYIDYAANLYFKTEHEGFVLGGDGGIYHTSNGGNTWQNEGPSGKIMQLFYSNNSCCYAIDKNGNVYKRTF